MSIAHDMLNLHHMLPRTLFLSHGARQCSLLQRDQGQVIRLLKGLYTHPINLIPSSDSTTFG